jgi:hypothetical protein
MTEKDPTKRAPLYEVVVELRKQERESIYVTLKNPEEESVVAAATYRWNPKLHIAFGHQLHYCLLKGSHPEGDVLWLKNNLDDRRIHGYSIYRILGGFDYLLRVWVKAGTAELLEEVLRRFHENQSGDSRHFTVKKVASFCEDKDMESHPRDQLLQAISACIDPTKDKEFIQLRDQGFVCSQLAKPPIEMKSHTLPARPIRFFVTLNTPNNQAKTNDRLGEICTDQYRKALDAVKTVSAADQVMTSLAKDISIYSGVGDCMVLIKFRLDHFHEFERIYMALFRTGVELNFLNLSMKTETYVEMDGYGHIESDDGPILEEINDFYRLNVPQNK